MKRIWCYGLLSLLAVGCGNRDDFDATGTFEATEVTVSAEANGRILCFDVEEGDSVEAAVPVGAIDTVQLYLQKLQLERQVASARSSRPDVRKQATALREQIAQQQTERRRVENLLKDGAATTKQLDDIDAQLKILQGQLDALLSTLHNNLASIDENSSAIEQSPLIVDYIARHDQAGKLVAAVCSAPAKVLGWHHLLKGRNYVCSSGLQETVDASEGTFVDQGVVISGNLITCKGLGHCFEFGAAIARALGCDLAATKTQHEHIYCEPQKLDFLQ